MANDNYLNLSPRLRTQADWVALWTLIQVQSAIYTSLEPPSGGMVLSASNEELGEVHVGAGESCCGCTSDPHCECHGVKT